MPSIFSPSTPLGLLPSLNPNSTWTPRVACPAARVGVSDVLGARGGLEEVHEAALVDVLRVRYAPLLVAPLRRTDTDG